VDPVTGGEASDQLRHRLLAMAEADERLRGELLRDGSLFEGYNPRMAELHGRNGRELEAIVDLVGWPGRALAGEDGAEAAWRVLQHAIGCPELQRRCLPLLREAAARGEVPPAYPAWLEDRIAFAERRSQRYGTQFDWDSEGRMSPWTIADPDGVDARRAAVGLPPLAEQQCRIRDTVAREGERPPGDYATRQREMRAWAERSGWIGSTGRHRSR
jgi:hypothetical protein